MTASEFAFLALGLVFGVSAGILLIGLIRSRPAAPRTIRVTMVAGDVPRRRAATLSEDAFATFAEPAAGGPGDRDDVEEYAAELVAQDRTIVRSRGEPPAGAGDPASSRPARRRPIARRIAAAAARDRAAATNLPPFALPASLIASDWGTIVPSRPPAIAIPIHAETDWTLAALRRVAAVTADEAIRGNGSGVLVAREARPRTAEEWRGSLDSLPHGGDNGANAGTAGGVGATNGASAINAMSSAGAGRVVAFAAQVPASAVRLDNGFGPPSGARDDDPCAGLRTTAEERCAVATRARERADATYDGLLAAHRAYDEHITAAERASIAGDQRAIRSAKEAAQNEFRASRGAAMTKDGVEAAARDWLSEINRINNLARDAALQLERERQTAETLVATIERLTVAAEASRIAADSADAACASARRALDECEQSDATQPVSGEPVEEALGREWVDPEREPDDDAVLVAATRVADADERPIVRLLRGHHETLGGLVDELAGPEPQERRRWQLALAKLVDAIVARSIEASILIFPAEHLFWAAFTRSQQRDIAAALSSLGYRFDGLGGWSDERIPSQRDLSLAVGYAGLDPMRIRRWPTEEETAELYRDVEVAADEYLSTAARGLTLGELITALGRRADALTEVWNEWPRLRPLLLGPG
ncbi:MAG TPA: hypothetical protein VGC90_03610 [Candidatus Limnocylindrales bacterium]